jgi:hypothetical protein
MEMDHKLKSITIVNGASEPPLSGSLEKAFQLYSTEQPEQKWDCASAATLEGEEGK